MTYHKKPSLLHSNYNRLHLSSNHWCNQFWIITNNLSHTKLCEQNFYNKVRAHLDYTLHNFFFNETRKEVCIILTRKCYLKPISFWCEFNLTQNLHIKVGARLYNFLFNDTRKEICIFLNQKAAFFATLPSMLTILNSSSIIPPGC